MQLRRHTHMSTEKKLIVTKLTPSWANIRDILPRGTGVLNYAKTPGATVRDILPRGNENTKYAQATIAVPGRGGGGGGGRSRRKRNNQK